MTLLGLWLSGEHWRHKRLQWRLIFVVKTSAWIKESVVSRGNCAILLWRQHHGRLRLLLWVVHVDG